MRKTRTRQHVIEDLSRNHVERQILLAGYSVERYSADYGLDLFMTTYNNNGEIEGTLTFFQLKATDHLSISRKYDKIEFSLSKRDLEFWLLVPDIIYLIIYDAKNEIGYYLNLQEYFQENRIALRDIKKYKNIFIPKTNVFNVKAVKDIRIYKNNITR